jgi:hypothetical protein
MSIHDGFLELAATSIDFELDEYDHAELDRHLAGCDECRRTAAAYRDDASAIAYEAGPALAPTRSEAILAAALRPAQRQPALRLLALAAVMAVLGAAIVAVGAGIIRRSDEGVVAVVPSPSSSSSAGPSTDSSGGPSSSLGLASQPPGTPRPVGSPAAGMLPVRGPGQQLGTQIQMAPGIDDDLYVSVPANGGSVLTRLDASGEPASGWPIFLPGAAPCQLLLTVDDGSVRIVCSTDDLVSEIDVAPVRAFAFDRDGRQLAGWPVELPCCFVGRIVGEELTVYGREYFGDLIEEGQPAGNGWIVTVAADGTVRNGVKVPFTAACCLETWTVGPDGVAYGTVHEFGETTATSELSAIAIDGVPSGFPVAINGAASGPAFDAAGHIHVTVGSPVKRPARTLVFDQHGAAVATGSGELDLAASSDWWGVGADYPAPPLVATDGTRFVIDTTNGTTVAAVSPSGQSMAGWPYRSTLALQDTGYCPPGDTGCGGYRAAPAVRPDNVLFLLHAAPNEKGGGSIAALDAASRPVEGWPVVLRRPGSQFWSIVVAPDSQAYALAIEPEPNGSHSATILSIAPDSTVEYTATVVEP